MGNLLAGLQECCVAGEGKEDRKLLSNKPASTPREIPNYLSFEEKVDHDLTIDTHLQHIQHLFDSKSHPDDVAYYLGRMHNIDRAEVLKRMELHERMVTVQLLRQHRMRFDTMHNAEKDSDFDNYDMNLEERYNHKWMIAHFDAVEAQTKHLNTVRMGHGSPQTEGQRSTSPVRHGSPLAHQGQDHHHQQQHQQHQPDHHNDRSREASKSPTRMSGSRSKSPTRMSRSKSPTRMSVADPPTRTRNFI
mmetsp:Transcript_25369/g.39792  ORF Transcript_25369/g.39792 Transcript_25369/m.39792 type:complete len:247 (-) Transcript_25369:141-881(-)